MIWCVFVVAVMILQSLNAQESEDVILDQWLEQHMLEREQVRSVLYTLYREVSLMYDVCSACLLTICNRTSMHLLKMAWIQYSTMPH